MPFEESFDIIAFHSRQHALYFNRILKEEGYQSMIMSTPKEVAIGCGLSVRYSTYQRSSILDIFRKHRKPIIGIFHVKRTGHRTELTRIPFS